MKEFEEENSVELIASGYEWICPDCNQFNKEIEVLSHVTCSECRKGFYVSDYLHAYG
jgi:hypothetical protein